MNYFSQAGEDARMIERYLASMPPWKRIYFEAGALDGVLYSNTKALEESLGWTGILVEPHPVAFNELVANRPNNKHYNCLLSSMTESVEYQYFPNKRLAAVSGVPETFSPFHRAKFYDKSDSEWMTQQQKDLQTVWLKPISMSELLNSSGFTYIGFASLDVEGHEISVLESNDWTFPIEYFLIESNNQYATCKLMEKQGYVMLERIGHNLLFCRPEPSSD